MASLQDMSEQQERQRRSQQTHYTAIPATSNPANLANMAQQYWQANDPAQRLAPIHAPSYDPNNPSGGMVDLQDPATRQARIEQASAFGDMAGTLKLRPAEIGAGFGKGFEVYHHETGKPMGTMRMSYYPISGEVTVHEMRSADPDPRRSWGERELMSLRSEVQNLYPHAHTLKYYRAGSSVNPGRRVSIRVKPLKEPPEAGSPEWWNLVNEFRGYQDPLRSFAREP